MTVTPWPPVSVRSAPEIQGGMENLTALGAAGVGLAFIVLNKKVVEHSAFRPQHMSRFETNARRVVLVICASCLVVGAVLSMFGVFD
ncbi:hypothetical protein O7635_36295 [Asanoa sp. WMMD1127]|uniref:hypothetical protein n=1 Tax=Asanoa sp. WMMD1127 TaxID=3016107 RepID=UPI0024164306|nr:hypothetical protein [Asanoa sp. WMMD1127]MDG4827336.1 hypothetical protein [Asanoa sp. WMMD1127]